jgi:kelch-like protein 10
MTDVTLHGVSKKFMDMIMDYAYSKTADINEDNVCELLAVSDYLSVLGLRQLCCNFLKNKLDINNCISIMLLAR